MQQLSYNAVTPLASQHRTSDVPSRRMTTTTIPVPGAMPFKPARQRRGGSGGENACSRGIRHVRGAGIDYGGLDFDGTDCGGFGFPTAISFFTASIPASKRTFAQLPRDRGLWPRPCNTALRPWTSPWMDYARMPRRLGGRRVGGAERVGVRLGRSKATWRRGAYGIRTRWGRGLAALAVSAGVVRGSLAGPWHRGHLLHPAKARRPPVPVPV